MSISWVVFPLTWPPKLHACKTHRPSDCADLRRQEASIMSISWVVFPLTRPPKLQTLAKPTARVIAQI